jgi:SRSO17 transposase
MERRFELRMDALLEECQVSPALFNGMTARLARFVEPFAACLGRVEQKEHALTYVSGLVSDLDRKNTESIAYRHDQDRLALQRFVGVSQWNHEPMLLELAKQVGNELGEPDAVIVFDPSAFAKKGSESVGVKRQWCGRHGKIENCQVGVYMGYVSSKEHALVDVRLYLPKDRANDRAHRAKCHIPKHVRYRTRHQLALEMLQQKRDLLPHAWIAGDDEMGRSGRFRRQLRESQERYLLAVPSNTLIRDLDATPPKYGGLGQPPKTPFVRVDRWREKLGRNAWTQVDVRDGEKGPLIVDVATCRVMAREGGRIGCEEVLVVIRRRDDERQVIHDYYLSNAPAETPPAEFARVAKAEHRIEETIQRGKSEAGLADYEVRSWQGWYHHQTLSLMATWFLVQEARRGKKMDACHHGSPDPRRAGDVAARGLRMRWTHPHRTRTHTTAGTKPARQVLSLETA